MACSSVSLLSNETATGALKQFVGGGRCALVVIATTFPTTLKLQLMGKDLTTYIDVATITTNGLTNYDLPPGQYRMFMTGGVPAGIYADLVSVSYGS